MIRVYNKLIMSKKELVNGQIFNAGDSNKSITQIAKIIKKQFKKKITLEFEKSNDNRSYHISSKKLKKRLNFKFRYQISDAAKELIRAFQKKVFFDTFDNPEYHNIKKMKKIDLQ